MKTPVARHDLFIIIAPLLAIAGILLYWFVPHAVSQAYYLNWFIFAVLFFLVITPWGNRRLAKDESVKPVNRFGGWFSKILALQIGLFALYYSIAALTTKIFPIASKINHHLFTFSLRHMLINDGLLPWSVFTLIAISLGYYAYRDQQDTYYSSTTSTLLPSEADKPWGLAFNTLARQATVTVIAATLAIFSLLVANIFTGKSFSLVQGFTSSATISVIVLLILVFIKPGKRYIAKLFDVKIPMMISLLISCITLAILLLFLSFIFKNPAMATNYKAPALLQNLLSKDPQLVWMLFSVSWWLAWTPLMGVFIARFSRGYRVRSVILASLVLPVILGVLVCLLTHYRIHFLTGNAYIAAAVGVVGFLLFFGIICQRKTLPMLLLSYLPKDEDIKYRDHHFFARKIIQMTILFFYIYLPGGIYLMAPFLFLLILPASLIPLLSSIDIFKKFSLTRKRH